MPQLPPFWKSLALGLLVTLSQVALAVAFSNPDGSWSDRYRTLVQHDSYWFANIIDRGYSTTVPPIARKEMEVSNVAFFPAYPWLAAGVARLTTLQTYDALLLTAQTATWGFWSYYFLLCARWELSAALQFFGALAIGAHPAAFYFITGYSESLFLAALVGFIFWSTHAGKSAPWLAALHGFVMSATRIVGLICALFPLVHGFCREKFSTWKKPAAWFQRLRGPLLLTLGAMLGGIAFFVYCQARWSRWDLYMLTQNAGWTIVPDYLAAFRPQNYHWNLPQYFDPPRVSQFVSALAGALFVALALLELGAAWRSLRGWRKRVGIYFCAAAIYYISLAGVASVQLESMLRYDLCVHALVVLGLLHFLRECRPAPALARAFAMGAVAFAAAAGLALQGYYVWNFTQGNWVA